MSFLTRRAAIVHGASDADALDWYARAVANGGLVNANSFWAVQQFCLGLKADGLWSKIVRNGVYAGQNLAAVLTPLKQGLALSGTAYDTNFNFIESDFVETVGLTGNTSTKYIDTGFVANTLASSDSHQGFYVRSSTGTSGRSGCSQGAGAFAIYPMFTDGSFYSDMYDTTANTGGRLSAASNTPIGFVLGSRTASNAVAMYQAGVSKNSSTGSQGGGLFAQKLFIHATNNSGSATSWDARPYTYYTYGYSFAAAQAAQYYNRVQALQSMLGRAV